MRLILILAMTMSTGCVAWQSSIDDIQKELANFQLDQSSSLQAFQKQTLLALDDADSAIGQTATRIEAQFQDAIASVAADVRKQGSDPTVTPDDLQRAISRTRDELMVTVSNESRNLSNALDQTRVQVLAAEKQREFEERVRAEQASKAIEAIRIENEKLTREAIASSVELSAQFFNTPAGGALLGKLIRDETSVSKVELQEKVPAIVNEVLTASGKDEMDPETAALLGGGASLIPTILLLLRKMSEKNRYEKMLEKHDAEVKV